MAGFLRRALLGAVALGLAGFGAQRLWSWATTRQPDYPDLAYGPGDRQKLDIYLPEGAGPFPFVIDIHGGAFIMGDKAMDQPSTTLLSAGIAVVRPNYRLSGTDRWPAQGEDCIAAALFVLQGASSWKLDPARFALWGQSAGGFLAVSTALSLIEQGRPPRAVVSFYGPMDFSTMDADMAALGRTAQLGTANDAESPESKLLGFTVGDNPEGARAVGPIARLEKMAPLALPPLLVRHGDSDPLIAQGQSERLVKAWQAADPQAEIDFALVPGGEHGGGDFNTDTVLGPLRDFLLRGFAK